MGISRAESTRAVRTDAVAKTNPPRAVPGTSVRGVRTEDDRQEARRPTGTGTGASKEPAPLRAVAGEGSAGSPRGTSESTHWRWEAGKRAWDGREMAKDKVGLWAATRWGGLRTRKDGQGEKGRVTNRRRGLWAEAGGHAVSTEGPVSAVPVDGTADKIFGLLTSEVWSVTENYVRWWAKSLRATSAGSRAQDTERATTGMAYSGGLGPVSSRAPTPGGTIDEGGVRTGARRGLYINPASPVSIGGKYHWSNGTAGAVRTLARMVFVRSAPRAATKA